jgi:hypothetical protein
MATYKGIQGYTVQKLSSDPSPTANVEGQLWYNSGTGKFKISVAGAGAWSSGATQSNTSRYDAAGAGILTAALAIAGYPPSLTQVEEYDGSAWSETTVVNANRYGAAGFGTATAALMAGGDPSTQATETFNGSTWTEVGDLNRAAPTVFMGGAGTTTAGLVFFGNPGNSVLNESWNGSSWTVETAGNTGRHAPFGLGVQTAALCAGGNAPPSPYQDVTEIWNGSTWTEVNDMNTARGRSGGVGGTTTNGLIAGGTNGPTNQVVTELWDGTSWTEVADLSKARSGASGTPAGTSGLALYAAGNPTGGETEEWVDPVYSIKTVTVS